MLKKEVYFLFEKYFIKNRFLKLGFFRQKAIFTVVVLFVMMGPLSGQNISRTGNAVQVGVGVTGVGPVINGYFSKSFHQSLRGVFGGTVTVGRVNGVQYAGFTLEGIASYTLGVFKEGSIRLNGQGGVSLLIDTIKEFESDEINSSGNLNAAIIGGIEGEFIINKSWSFLLTSRLKYHVKEDFGRIRYDVGISARFLIDKY